MNMQEITLNLPSELIERAREQGLLSSERIAVLIEAEIDRLNRWQSLDKSLEPVREGFHAEHSSMSETDMMALLNEVVHEVRDETAAQDDKLKK